MSAQLIASGFWTDGAYFAFREKLPAWVRLTLELLFSREV